MGSTHSGGFTFRKGQFNNKSRERDDDRGRDNRDHVQNDVISEKVEILYEFK